MKYILLGILISMFVSCAKHQETPTPSKPIPIVDKPVKQPDTTRLPKRIIWFGDSITRGESSSDYTTKSYAALVSAFYQAENINYGYSSTCVDPRDGYQGVPGHNLIDIYNNANTGQTGPENYVCVQYGTNDLAGGYGAADRIPAWIGYYRDILKQIIAFGYKPNQIIIMTQPYEGRLRTENGIQPLKDLADELDCRFFDTWDYCKSVGWVVGVDTEPSGIHPYDVGHAKIANGLITYINTF